MKRILVHGNRRLQECNQCGCVFTYEKEDVIVEATSVNDCIIYVSCPDCNYTHELSTNFD